MMDCRYIIRDWIRKNPQYFPPTIRQAFDELLKQNAHIINCPKCEKLLRYIGDGICSGCDAMIIIGETITTPIEDIRKKELKAALRLSYKSSAVFKSGEMYTARGTTSKGDKVVLAARFDTWYEGAEALLAMVKS